MQRSLLVTEISPVYILFGFWVLHHILVFLALVKGLDASNWFVGILGGWFLHIFGQGIGLHRLFSHKSFKVNSVVNVIFCMLATLCVLGSPLAWAALHREHHKTSDTAEDPHSPKNQSFLSLWWGGYLFQQKIYLGNVRDLLANPIHRFFHKYYFLILGSTYSVVAIVFGFKWLVTFLCFPAIITFHLTMLGAYLVHKVGYQNFNTNDSSKNSIFVSLLTFGDGWHNNHHKYPNRSYHGVNLWEFDLQGWIIYLLFKGRAS